MCAWHTQNDCNINRVERLMIKLYGSFTSPFVRHCRIALLQSGAEFEFIETNYEQSAQGSVAMRVPYLEHNGLTLNDSMSILRYVRERHDQIFCRNLAEYDLLLLINAALDSTVNLFLMENSGVDIANNDYTQRQSARVEQCLKHLELVAHDGLEWNDAGIRLACFIDWAKYRQRLNFERFPALEAWLESASHSKEFQLTSPPAVN